MQSGHANSAGHASGMSAGHASGVSAGQASGVSAGQASGVSAGRASGKSAGHASGKVVLLGEHAVVYDVPAIAAGIERGAVAEAVPAAAPTLCVNGQVTSHDPEGDVVRALTALLAELGAPPMRVDVQVDIPLGCGLGASAAMGVASARAVMRFQNPDESPPLERVLRAADAWERVFHGNPSGLDAATAALGNCLWFTRREGPQVLSVGGDFQLALAVAGPPASTRQMVESVARLKARRPELVEKTLSGISALVTNGRYCIEAGDAHGLGKLMDLNQMLLSGLFLSTEAIEDACHVAREAGALGAKLTGAGGGGAVVALVESDPSRVLAAWEALGLDCFVTTLHANATTNPA